MITQRTQPTTDRSNPQNDIIESITGRRYISWSQLSGYRSCPRRWTFNYVEHLDPDTVSAALVLGSGFHAAAQVFYERYLQGLATTLEELYEAFNKVWHEQADATKVQYPKAEDEASVKETGQRMIEALIGSESATPTGTILAVEETLSGSIHPEMPDLLGVVDLVWQDDDGIHLSDLKSSKSRWSAAKVNEAADQIRLYRKLACDLVPDQPLHAHFTVVTKAVKPVVQQIDVPDESPERTSDIADVMLPVWNSIKAGADFASPSPINCGGCGYRSKCPAYRG